MQNTSTQLRPGLLLTVLLLPLLMLQAQVPTDTIPPSTQLRQYVIYAEGATPTSLDTVLYGVQVGSGTSIGGGGFIGSRLFISFQDNNGIGASLFSGNLISLGQGNTLSGNLASANERGLTAPVIRAGDNQIGLTDPTSGGIIHSRGNISIDFNSSVVGPVRVQTPYTYTGPEPFIVGPQQFPSVNVPTLPALPDPLTFPTAGSADITGTNTITAGLYGDIALSGGATLVFSEPGTYVFSSIQNNGNNTFEFTFPPGSTERYNLYVHGDVDLDSLRVIINGVANDGSSFPLAEQIYTEVHGNGASQGGDAFILMSDGSGGESNWAGTVYAPNGRIRFGISGNTILHGALWSRHRVIIGSGATLYFRPLPASAADLITPVLPMPTDGRMEEGTKIDGLLYGVSTSDTTATSPDLRVVGDRIWVEVIAQEGKVDAVRSALVDMGLTTQVFNEPGSLVITGLIPIDRVQELNTINFVDYARPLYEPLTKSGAVESEGVATMRADLVAAGYPGVRGHGVKIGVISDSYDRSSATIQYAPLDVEAGELPGREATEEPVQVVLDYTIGYRSDEGRAMLQIIHDVAPGAKLAFRTGFLSAGDFANGVRRLADPALPGGKCDVIVDDVSYLTEPYFTDGVISKAVKAAVESGTTYITSAGNFGERSYEALFQPLSVAGISGLAHNFGAGNAYQALQLKAGFYTIMMQWEDQFYSLGGNTGATIDMDFYLTDGSGALICGFNRNNLGADPYEVLSFEVEADTEARLLIVKKGGATPPAGFRIKYIIFRGNAVIVNNDGNPSTIVGQANAADAITVGAILYKDPYAIPGYPTGSLPPGFSYPSVASFSSRGGTVISGEAAGTRLKPDLIAPNGVNTTVPLGSSDIDGDNRPNFFGTSAAAPHAAAVAALLIEGRRTFLGQATTPAQLRQLLRSTATPLGAGGHSTSSGFGLTNADNAMRTMANPKPALLSLHMGAPPPSTVINPIPPAQTTAFTLVARGVNLSATTKIVAGGQQLETTLIAPDMVSAPLTTNAPNTIIIQLFTPPRTAHGDGGYSNEFMGLYDAPKKVVEVKVANAVRKFGETNPAFSSIVTVDGQPVSDAQRITLRLNELVYTTTAVPSSPAYVYPITASLPLAANDPLFNDYEFVYRDGALTVGKLPLTITPVDKTIRLGEPLEVSYQLDFGNPNIAPGFNLEAHTATLYGAQVAPGALAVMHGYSTASPALSDADLVNRSALVSFQSLRNARRFLTSEGYLVPAPATLSEAELAQLKYLVDVPAAALNLYKESPYLLELVESYPGSRKIGLAASRDVMAGAVTTPLPGGEQITVSNGDLLNLLNGQLMTISNGVYIVDENGDLVEVLSIKIYENGEVEATLANGQLMTISNTELMIFTNGQLMTISNGQLMTISNGQLMTISNGQLMTIANGEMFIVVNGEIQFVDKIVIKSNGEVEATLANGQLMTISNGQLMTISNGQLMTISNTELALLANGQLMTISNSAELVALVNGQLMTISNNLPVGSGTSNTGSMLVVEEADVAVQGGALGGVLAANMITGLEAGQQKLLAATFVNDSYDITYGIGTVTILAPAVSLTASDPVPIGSNATVQATSIRPVSNRSWQLHSTPPTPLPTIVTTSDQQLVVTHTVPGVYPVTMSYQEGSESFTTTPVYAVFYDSTMGFVTGAGSIHSPFVLGVPYMGVEGRAHFGFVSKYVKGRTTPTGTTQFEFQAGGLSFRSTDYQWLVVSGARAQFKGTGSINDAGSYSFILTAVDGALLGAGQPDRFRIKIWDPATGVIQYDNVYGMGDNADLASFQNTTLLHGSVVVHTGSSKKVTTLAPGALQPEEVYSGPLKVTATPNPTRAGFTLTLQSGSAKAVTVTVSDLMGRSVEQRSGVAANGTLRLGARYGAGIYLLEVRQGSERRLLRLVKTTQ